MKKITLLLLLICSVLTTQAQLFTTPAVDSARIGKADGTSGVALYGDIYLKNTVAGLLRLNADRKFVTTTLAESDIPSLPISKVTGLGDSLTAKANLVLGKVPLNELMVQKYSISIPTDTAISYGKDGIISFSDNEKQYLVGGWNGGLVPTTDNEQWESLDSGVTWTQLADAPFTGRHTVATETVDDKTYIVGGDYYNLTYDGSYAKDSWVFDAGSWTQIAADAGIGNRILSELVFHDGAFYLIGGQVSTVPSAGLYTTVLKSTDTLKTFTSIGTTPFAGGNLWGAVASFNGKMWKVGGGVYSDINSERTYPREIYSSTDGITWILEGTFPGVGRSYAQLIVFDNKLWITHGFNHNEGNNLNDIWFSEDGVNWTESDISDIYSRHAHSAWTNGESLFWAGGSTNGTPSILSDVVKIDAGSTLDEVIAGERPYASITPRPMSLAQRDGQGNLEGVYLRSTNAVTLSSTPSYLTGKLGDGYLYEFSQSAVRNFLGYADVALSASYNDLVDKPTEGLFTGQVRWGLGSYEAGISKIYNDASLGTVLLPKAGSTSDFLLGNSLGGTVFDVPTGTSNIRLGGDMTVQDEAYSSSWNASLEVPTKNAVYDKIESLATLSGTYTPTCTSKTNIASVTPSPFMYTRVGNMVTVYGVVSCTTTATGNSEMYITLPIASTFTSFDDLFGHGNTQNGGASDIVLNNENGGDKAILDFSASVTTSKIIYFSFTYKVI